MVVANINTSGISSTARVRGLVGLGSYGAPQSQRGLGTPRGPGNVRGPGGTRGPNLEDDPRGPGRLSGSDDTDCVSSSTDNVNDIVCTNNAGQLTVSKYTDKGSGTNNAGGTKNANNAGGVEDTKKVDGNNVSNNERASADDNTNNVGGIRGTNNAGGPGSPTATSGPGGGNCDSPIDVDTFPQSATEPTDDNPDDTQPLIVCDFCRLTVYNMPNMPTQRRITPQITTDNNAGGVGDTNNDGGNNVSNNKQASGNVSTNKEGGIRGTNNAGGPGSLTGPGGNDAGKRHYGLPAGVDRYGRYRTPSGFTGPFGGYSSYDYLLGRPFGNPFREYRNDRPQSTPNDVSNNYRANVSRPLDECYFCGLAIYDVPTPSKPAADRRRMPPAGNKTNPTQQPGTTKK